MLRIAWEGGVNVAFGTDTGVSKHGDNAQEFIYMIKAGMSEQDTLEAGKYADLIAVDGNPLKDIEELLDVDFVMKGGVVYKEN